MEKFTTLRGVAAPLPMVNVDTDMIIPKQLPEDHQAHRLEGRAVLRDALRRPTARRRISSSTSRPTATPRSSSPARTSAAARAASTRPGRCSISASAASSPEDFADIFYNNCFKNGILPIKLPQEIIDKLMDDASRGANAIIEIDLEKQEIKGPDGGTVHFDIDPFRKHCLLNGLDDIGLTMEKKSEIDDFEARQKDSPALAARGVLTRRHLRPERKKTMAANRNLLVLPGDGIGPEVMNEVRKIIDWMGKKRAVGFDIKEDAGGRRRARRAWRAAHRRRP